ncbi:DUF1801 domain-containing protein [Flavobacterium sp.]|uniref:DUF1801 domain-containing protein n=1 Tax=Flavobacterium sp. TaxID=239 RepID=UPI003752D495
MQSQATSPDKYIAELPEDRRNVMQKLRKVVQENIPKGFKEVMSYGMLGYVVPHETYPNGYHCTPELPLPFFAMASQKNSINIYHMVLYSDKKMHDWFVEQYPKHCKSRLDMGKSCVRFKKLDDIPYALIGELISKVTVEKCIEIYENTLNKKNGN